MSISIELRVLSSDRSLPTGIVRFHHVVPFNKIPHDRNRAAARGINGKILKIKGRSHSRAISSADIVAVDFNPRMLMVND